jgi:uncharacterized protein
MLNVSPRSRAAALLLAVTLSGTAVANGVDVRDADGQTRLMHAASGYCDPVTECRYIDGEASLALVVYQLELGADVHARDPQGWTPLMFAAAAASSEHVGILRALLAAGAEVNIVDNLGRTPLVLALENARIFAPIEVLLEAGADVNAGLLRGRPPLVVAVDPGFPFWSDEAEIIQALLLRGADVVALLDHGVDPNLRVGQLDVPLLAIATYAGSDDAVLHLLVAGADPNLRTAHGWSAFTYAVALGRSTAVVTTLLDAGAFVDATAPDGAHVLQLSTGRPDQLQLLLDRGARVEARNDLGLTALMHAAMYGHVDSAQRLLRAGARVDARDNDGRTALIHGAMQLRPSIELINRLLEHGADVNARDAEGATSLYRAALTSSPDLITLLLDAGADARAATHAGTMPITLARVNRSLGGTEALRRLERLSRP